jgi:hypothetical protein
MQVFGRGLFITAMHLFALVPDDSHRRHGIYSRPPKVRTRRVPEIVNRQTTILTTMLDICPATCCPKGHLQARNSGRVIQKQARSV